MDDEIIIGVTTTATIGGGKKRPSPKKRKPKNKKLRLIIRCTCIFIFLAVLIVFLMVSPMFNIEKIVVEGNSILSTEKIISLSEIKEGNNIFRFNRFKASDKIKELKSDDIDKRNQTIVKTFEVTSSDLTNYKIANDYVPGKSNPFGSKKTNPDAGSSTNKSGNTIDTNSGTTRNIKTADEEDSETKKEEKETENVITTK